MGRLSIFSWSSAKGSNSGSDISRSWTLMSRPQSTTTQPGQQKIVSARVTDPDALKESKTECTHCDEGATSSHSSQKENANPCGATPQAGADAPSSGVLEPLTLGPNTGSVSRRLAGFKTLFHRKYRRRRLEFVFDKDEAAEDACDTEGAPGSTLNYEVGRKDDEDAAAHQLSSSPRVPVPGDDTRKVSDTTEKSVNSSTTNVTVCHHPSKRLSMPIIVVDRDIAHPNPFDDVWEASRSETHLNNPFKEQTKTSESTDRSSSGYSGSENPFSSFQGHILELSNSSRSSWGCPSGLNGWPTPADRRFATDAFNKLASELFLDPLSDNAGRTDEAVDEIFVSRERLERRRDRLLGRIRMMRSTMHIRSEPAMPRARGLRRMKTFTALPDRPYLMTSLLGKPLETLARLGGYSFLTLPGDFAPATMSLPVCFVATINYLRTYGTLVQNLFADPGDLETATQAYHYFAQQVLSAEKERTKIHMTMRSSKMPEFLDDVSVSDEAQSSHILSVAFAFRALLAGLPGGILGSVQLWRMLVNIYHGRICPQSVQRTGSCLAGLSAEDYAKVRAISLAIVALTTSMQLNLICGVFGLCSLLLHETERISEIERRQRRANRRIVSGADKLSLERFTVTLGPLLIETRGQGDDPGTFRTGLDEIESQRVVTLLIGHWRSISRQLRIWERRGLEGRAQAQGHAQARAMSRGSEKAVETGQKDCI
ncbi:hypothetical protein BDW66DRAFT_80673 [Aspergillus desertorum]